MNVKRVGDQADGLRRLMGQRAGRRVAVLGSHAGAGATSVALELGAALALQGQDAVLVDEHKGSRSASALVAGTGRAWGLVPVQMEVRGAGIALIDAALDAQGGLSTLARQADDVLVVLQPQVESIKSAYACIKRLHLAHGLRQLRFVLNATSDAASAAQVARNLMETGSRYLAVSLLPAGCVPFDTRLPHAQQLGLGLVQAFPASAACAELRRIAADLLHWPQPAAWPAAA